MKNINHPNACSGCYEVNDCVCETLFSPVSIVRAAEILKANGYSEADAQFAARATFALNEGFDGEPTRPETIARLAMRQTVAELRRTVETYYG